ncbi:hypothetical protein TeGR_g9554 [Tetraparma gracilis]|uniref:EF-hand domain-containing protein n=1 Tax=Tetraparma gracilis TaxID=2962635 RepID=A0ABQ6MV64_9STRA|nr:hypothetical protein TeGR_g9554 [Tetraparma gracilis]
MPPISPTPEPLPRNDLAAPNSSTSPATIESILDVDRNGYLDRLTLLRGLYILGLDPSPRDLAPVLAELDMQHVSLTEGQYQSDHMVNSALNKLLDEAGIKIDEAAELIDYYAAHNRCRREDDFVHLTKKAYFVKRTLALNIPLAASLTTSHFMPKFTENEIAVHAICKNVIGGFSSFQSIVVPLTAISFVSGWTKKLGALDVIATALVNGLLIWGAQAWREAAASSQSGAILKDKMLLEKFLLRHTFFTAEDGGKVAATATAARIITGEGGGFRLGSLTGQITHHRFARMLKTKGKRRFSAAPDPSDPLPDPTLDIEQAQGGLPEAFLEHLLDNSESVDVMDERYNITRCGIINIAPHIIAVFRALLPQIFRLATGKPIIFSESFTAWENVLEVLNMIFIFLFSNFAALVLFLDALDGSAVEYRLASHLHALVAKKSDMSTSWRVNKAIDHINMRKPENVTAYAQLHRFFTAVTRNKSAFHLATAELLAILAIIYASLTLFGTAFYNLPVEAWTVSSLVDGSAALAVSLKVFAVILDVENMQQDKIALALAGHEMDLSDLLERTDASEGHADAARSGPVLLPEATAELKLALLEIKKLRREINSIPHFKLFGYFPFTKQNLAKLGGAVCAAFFSTIVRKALLN